MKAYHFVSDTLRDGSPIPPDGVTLVHDGELKPCASGLHASLHPFDALQYAPGNTLCLVELGGTIIEGDDKVVASERTIIKRIDATELLRKFARDQALSVIHLWDAPDVVRKYLETGDESLRSAAAAADAAAWYAARYAADAARYAAAAARYAAWYAADAAAADAWYAADAAWYAARYAADAAAAVADASRADFKTLVDKELGL